jgi:DUF1680 family protein
VGWVTRLGWLANLSKAGTGERYEHRGRQFADSEIYKLVEAMSWERARSSEPGELDAALDEFIDAIASAQDPDGYLHSLFGRPWQQSRYSDIPWGHELYCFGHLIQAAVANHRATGETKLLDVARKLADHVVVMFGPDGMNKVCGHPEIEVALMELYRETGEQTYLDQAKLFIDRRGNGLLPLAEMGRQYWQDDMPVRQADVLRGHAVRALYLAAGAVDLAVETGDDELLAVLETQWLNTVAKRTYVTGGMGSHHMDEAFGDDFVLPPDRSYCESCAGVASIMFSWRLLLATGNSKYADLIERTLYNVVATSPAEDGKSFFYANPLHQRNAGEPAPINEDGVCIRGGSSIREAWFEVSCCPPNIARTLASLSSYVATTTEHGLQLHQYVAGEIAAELSGGRIAVRVDTAYPADGRVTITVVEAPAGPDGSYGPDGATLTLRIPGWGSGATVTTPAGAVVEAAPGSWVSRDALAAGDVFVLDLPMAPRVIVPDHRIDAIRGTVAVERGPEVLALESPDLPDGWSLDELFVAASVQPSFADGRVSIAATRIADGVEPWPYSESTGGNTGPESVDVALIPYHSWANRGPATMRIWLPTL